MNRCTIGLLVTRMASRSVSLSKCPVKRYKQYFSTCIDTARFIPRLQSSSPLVLDLTLGEGRIARDLLKDTSVKLIGVDCDPKCMETISKLKEDFGDRFTGILGKWSDLPSLMNKHWTEKSCDLVLLDLGVSSKQLLDKDRGFNMEENGQLDMRFNMEGLTCEQLIKHAGVEHLSKILKVYGGVLKSKTVARDILERKFLMEEIKTTNQLLEVLLNSHDRDEFWEAQGDNLKHENIKKVFLGLRMFVNDELNEMEFVIRLAEIVLSKGGLLVCGVGTELEQNFLRKLIFREPVRLEKEEEEINPSVKKNWEEVERTSSEVGKEVTACLVFRRC